MASDIGSVHIVQKGDTLESISAKTGVTISDLRIWNEKKYGLQTNPTLVVGMELYLYDPSGIVAPAVDLDETTVTIKKFGLQSDTDRTVFVQWEWTKENTKNYEVEWSYYTKNDIWFTGSTTTVEHAEDKGLISTYTAPSNAEQVYCRIKPISETKLSWKGQQNYWEAKWKKSDIYSFSDNPPSTPAIPNVTLVNYNLTATLDNLNVNADKIQFELVINNGKQTSITSDIPIVTGHVSYTWPVSSGCEYKVRCRSVRGELFSDWTNYSGNYKSGPARPSNIKNIKALTESSVYIEWVSSDLAEGYIIQYTDNKDYFDSSEDNVSYITVKAPVTHAEITGLNPGTEYFFRVCATASDSDNSNWTETRSIKIGTAPSAPNTWSSTFTVVVGEKLYLYWMHNSEDGSDQTVAELYIKHNNGTEETKTFHDTTSVYEIDTTSYKEGRKIEWKVRTKGIINAWSDWSALRSVNIYAQPTVSIRVANNANETFSTLNSFPFTVTGTAGPNTQSPIGYHLSIVSKNTYETTDSIGNSKLIKAGEEVYSQYFNMNTSFSKTFTAGDIDLESDQTYTLTLTAHMNSGLSGSASTEFNVIWEAAVYTPNAEIGIDSANASAYIRPYCVDKDNELVENVTLAVYRRDYDGGFTEIASGLKNSNQSFVTDPHPSLDYARYRIVVSDDATGAINYYDMPGRLIGESSVYIQWNENWSNFDISGEDPLTEPTWAGSLLKIPYNITIADEYTSEVSLIKYIGREHPVGYHGTQKGFKSTWTMAIPKTDKDTLYAIRRLAVWMDNVYVREPSGSGYWASIDVTYEQSYEKLTIPITFNVTRVEGGM